MPQFHKFSNIKFQHYLFSVIRDNGKSRFEQTTRLLNEDDKNAVLEINSDLLYHHSIKNLSGFQICREAFMLVPVVIYTKKNFYLLRTINEKIEIFKAAGLIEYWYSLSFNKELLTKHSIPPKVLTFDHLSGCFFIWICGCLVSLLTLVFELMINYIKRRKNLT